MKTIPRPGSFAPRLYRIPPTASLLSDGIINLTRKLNYTIVHTEVGRIYALNLGLAHRNPDNQRGGDKHKHYWSEQSGDRAAYVPEDIT